MSSGRWLGCGPPLVQIDGRWYLNTRFEVPVQPNDTRLSKPPAGPPPGVPVNHPLVLRALTLDEEQMLSRMLDDALFEAWAKMTA